MSTPLDDFEDLKERTEKIVGYVVNQLRECDGNIVIPVMISSFVSIILNVFQNSDDAEKFLKFISENSLEAIASRPANN